jgi:hypothetical protein
MLALFELAARAQVNNLPAFGQLCGELPASAARIAVMTSIKVQSLKAILSERRLKSFRLDNRPRGFSAEKTAQFVVLFSRSLAR